jgi:hypothetical protein
VEPADQEVGTGDSHGIDEPAADPDTGESAPNQQRRVRDGLIPCRAGARTSTAALLRPPIVVVGETTLVATLRRRCQHGSVTSNPLMNSAQLLVRLLEQHGVTHVFGMPGAKVDSVFRPCSVRRSSW